MSAEAKLAEVGRKGRAFEEVGSTGINYWRQGASGKGQYVQISEDFLSALRGTTGIKVYTEMSENDPIIGGIVMMFEQLLKQIPWYVDPVDKTDQAKKDAEFVAQCKDDMTHTWSEFVDEALTFLIYGWSWHEIVYKMRDGKKSRYSDGKIGWRKFAPRAQSSFDSWEFDESGELIGMQQNPPPAYKLRHLPLEVGGIQKSIHFMTLSRKRNPEGRSVLRNAYSLGISRSAWRNLKGLGLSGI